MIQLHKLWKKFGRHDAVKDLSFAVPEGSAFALIGANGAGKTTTTKILMNILEPTQGTAEILGVNSRKISPRELAQIGYVSENQDMPEKLMVAQFLAYLRSFYPTWEVELEKSLLRQLRLPLDPRRIYDGVKNRPLRLEVDYSLTLLEGNSYTIPALGGDQVLPGLGRCTTKMDDDGDDIKLQCIQAGVQASCGAAFLEHVPTGRRNPAAFGCQPNYAPFLIQFVPDGISRFGSEIRFHDLSGLAKYPVDAAQLPESRVVIRVYEAQDHFTRQLVIPEIRLSDWQSELN